MEIFFIVIGAIILLFGTLLLLPVKIDFAYDGEVFFKVKYLGFTLINSEEKVKKTKKVSKKKKKDNSQTKKSTNKQKNITDTIKYYSNMIQLALKQLRWLIKFIKIRKFVFDLTVATDNAASTAIEYGEMCAVVYPIISFIQTNTNFKFKTDNINIRPDFETSDSKLKASVLVKAKLIICLIAIARLLWDYTKKQRKESEKNE